MAVYRSHQEGFGVDRKCRLTYTDIEKVRLLRELVEKLTNPDGGQKDRAEGGSHETSLETVMRGNFEKLAFQLEKYLRFEDIR